MKLEDINKSTWFVDRYVKHVPKHFVATHSKVTDENLTWVYERTYGRFSIVRPNPVQEDDSMLVSTFWLENVYAFEDPKEAVQFELTWA
jgi:hypothetical protein